MYCLLDAMLAARSLSRKLFSFFQDLGEEEETRKIQPP